MTEQQYHYIVQRAIMSANYIIENNATLRSTAKALKIPKSTIHKDITYRLKYIDNSLYKKVSKVLSKNKEERARRGGEATKQKYLNKR